MIHTTTYGMKLVSVVWSHCRKDVTTPAEEPWLIVGQQEFKPALQSFWSPCAGARFASMASQHDAVINRMTDGSSPTEAVSKAQ